MSDDKNKKKPTKKKEVKINRLDMGINEFGELTTSVNLDDINSFLNNNVEDKKLNEGKKKKN
jgi:hypothetical protein